MAKKDYGTEIPEREIELLARRLLPEIKKYFADERVQREFEDWKIRRENNNMKVDNIK